MRRYGKNIKKAKREAERSAASVTSITSDEADPISKDETDSGNNLKKDGGPFIISKQSARQNSQDNFTDL